MIRATLCLAALLTLLLALAHGMTGGGTGPMIAAALVCVFGLPQLIHQRHTPFHQRRS